MTQEHENPNDLLTDIQTAEILDVSPATLSVWRSTGRYGIPFIKIGFNVRYRRGDLMDWLDKRTRQNGATA